MIRVVLESLLLFLLPTLVYVGYVMLTRPEAGSSRQVLAEAPVFWLSALGAVLVVLVMIVFGSTVGGKPNEGYEPPELRDGKIIPGHRK